jgi:uncharacterized protein with FMN-binding domain
MADKRDRKRAEGDAVRGGTSPASSGKGLKSSLTAIGTAAVLGVYAAGYARTDAAARRMEEELASHRLASAPPVARRSVTSSLFAATAAAPSAPPRVSSDTPRAVGAALRPRSDAPTPSASSRSSATQAPPDPSTATSAPEVAAAEAPPAAPIVPAEPAVPESPYKDGVYKAAGWETRHGHVEVAVEIAEGRIASAAVVYCGMRWPCSDVNELIARVPQMQSSRVGMISGASQTSEAFTSAVATALSLSMAAKIGVVGTESTSE